MTDWDGTAYRRVNELQQWLADRALDGLELTGVRALLDVGCGDGRITAEIARRIPNADVVGIDPSPRMIAVAPASGRLTFRVGDVLALPFENEFDVVVSFNALHWVRDQQAALARIGAALRRPGRALLVFVCGGPRASLEQVAMDVAATPPWLDHFTGFVAPFAHPDPAEYPTLVAAGGLQVVDVHVDDLAWDFGSTEMFRRWCAVGFDAWTGRLPGTLRSDFVDAVVDAYAAATGSAQTLRFTQLRARLQGRT